MDNFNVINKDVRDGKVELLVKKKIKDLFLY